MEKKNVTVIFGGAGFIGKTLVDLLVNTSLNILVIVDNLSNGKLAHLEQYLSSNRVYFFEKDCSIASECNDIFLFSSSLGSVDSVWHLAANSDIPSGTKNPNIDLKDTFFTTYNIVNGINNYNIKRLYFASSSAIYGDFNGMPITEDAGPLLPISNYGAMKLASEAFISAAAEQSKFDAFLFRFPNVVGTPATHGVIFDFCNKLIMNPLLLDVLGNGSQKKSYLHVSDLVDAMLYLALNLKDKGVFPINIGPLDDGVTVKWIAEEVVKFVSPTARIVYGSESRGWVGDVPKFNYSIDKLINLGWRPKLSSSQAVQRAIVEIAAQLNSIK